MRKVIIEIIEFVLTHFIELIIELFLTIFLGMVVANANLYIVLYKTFSGNWDLIKMAAIEAPSIAYSANVPQITMLCVTALFYLYFIVIEPLFMRSMYAYNGNYERYQDKTGSRLGTNVVYALLFLIMFAIFSSTGDTKDMREFQQDITKYQRGEAATSIGILTETDYYLNPEGDARIQPDSRLEYMSFLGENEEGGYCMRMSKKMREKIVAEPNYLYQVTYLPNRKIITDIKPIKPMADSAKTDEIYGHEHFTEEQRQRMDVMMGESLRDMWLAREDKESFIPISFDTELPRDDFYKLYDYYLSYNFEYGFLPYRYAGSGSNTNTLVVAEYSDGVYSNGDYYVGADELKLMERYLAYNEALQNIVDGMPEYDSDLEKIEYLTNYVVSCATPLDEDECANIEDFEQRFLCESGYGNILAGASNSAGYAQAMYGLFKRAGLEALPVSTKRQTYCLNMVKADGSWYYLDAYILDRSQAEEGRLFGDRELEKYLHNDRPLEFFYGYTEEKLPVADGSDLSFKLDTQDDNREETKFDELVTEANKINDMNSVYPIPHEDEAAIAKWAEDIFSHVPFGEFHSNEPYEWYYMEYKRGKECNQYATELFKYLTILSCNQYDVSGKDVFLHGIIGQTHVISAKEFQEKYKYYTGMSDEQLFKQRRYKTPDNMHEFLYYPEAKLIVKLGDGEYVQGNNMSEKVVVDKVEKTQNGYEVVFYIAHNGFGDHYFTLNLVFDGEALLIDEIGPRYKQGE